MKNLATVVCAVGMLVGSAAAQDAVQWRAEDGGNGHWYAAVISKAPLSWTAARDSASGLGGHLATLTSAEENSWVYERVASSAQLWSGPQGPYLGAYRDTTLGCGSLCGWQWVTREVWGFSSWDPGNPSGGDEAFLHFGNTVPCWCPGPHWNDIADSNGSWPISAFITEWSADCNNDGIVDFGQIASGQLADLNANNIPDCCESGTPTECAGAGGGGGNTNLILNGGFDAGTEGWSFGNIDGAGGWRATGGHRGGCFILNDGGSGATDPTIAQTVSLAASAVYRLSGEFRGEAIAHSPPGGVSFAVDIDGVTVYSAQANDLVTWRNFTLDFTAASPSAVVQLRAEINGTDNDFVIDNIALVLVAPPSCLGDVTGNGVVNGVDLAALLDAWGTDGQGQFDCDLTNDGLVNGADLSVVLSDWGSCP